MRAVGFVVLLIVMGAAMVGLFWLQWRMRGPAVKDFIRRQRRPR